MLEYSELSDLYNLLFDSDRSEHNSSTDDLSTCAQNRRKRNRRRYDTPKVFKNDIRWSYSNMFVNVLSSSDVYVVHEFLTTFAIVNLQHINRLKPDADTSWTENYGIDTFLKHWFLSTCVAPDIVYGMGQPSVRNLIDGSSEVTFTLTVSGNFIFEKPSLSNDASEGLIMPYNDTVGQKRKLISHLEQTRERNKNSKYFGSSGVRRPSSKQRNRIRVGEYSASRKGYLTDNLLDELDSIVLTSFSNHPVNVKSSGHFTMRLDSDKRIISTVFEQIDDHLRPIELSDV